MKDTVLAAGDPNQGWCRLCEVDTLGEDGDGSIDLFYGRTEEETTTTGYDRGTKKRSAPDTSLATNSTALTDSVTTKAKKTRGISTVLAELYSHFIDTGQKNEKSNHARLQCRYCVDAYEGKLLNAERNCRRLGQSEKSIERAQQQVQKPKTFNRSRQNCESHLKSCLHAKTAMAQLKEQTNHRSSSASLATATCSASSVSRKSTIPESVGVKGTPVSTLTSTSITVGNQMGIKNFTVSRMTKDEAPKAKDLLTEFIVSCALAYSIVDHPAFKRFCESVRPGSSKLLGNRKSAMAIRWHMSC
jgi:hypothetical protein